MKTRHALIALTVLITVPAVALAGWFGDERPPANAKPLSEIIKGVEEAGHKTIVELEFEDGVYEIEALDAQGKEVKLKVDPVSGKVNVKLPRRRPCWRYAGSVNAMGRRRCSTMSSSICRPAKSSASSAPTAPASRR